MKALLNKRNSSLFGRSSEKLPASASVQQMDDHENASDSAPTLDKKRGARVGHKGHGRKIPDLSEVEVIHEISDVQMYCPICGKPRRITPLAEVSYEIDYETRADIWVLRIADIYRLNDERLAVWINRNSFLPLNCDLKAPWNQC